MLLRRKQKPNDDEQSVPRGWSWQATEREDVGRPKTGTASFAEFSKLTAKMVELSQQEAQRERTLRGPVPDNLSAVRSPMLWPATDVQRTPQRSAESAGRAGTGPAVTPLTRPQAHGTLGGLRIANFAVLYSRATIILQEMANYSNEVPRTSGSWLARLRFTSSAVVGNLSVCWKSVQNDHRLATFRARIGHLTIAVQRTDLIPQRTALLIGRWSRWATTAQSLANRLSARLRILTNSQPLRRLRYECRKNLRFPLAKPYRCRDCGKGVGFHSRPRTVMERYILRLTLMQPVRCAECSRRDYRLIFTPVRERSHHRDESNDPIHRDAA
jgi:DNA-directed RNA polymerase subunit RPC12/RpoP